MSDNALPPTEPSSENPSAELNPPGPAPGTPQETHDPAGAKTTSRNPSLENIRALGKRIFSWGGKTFQKGGGRPSYDANGNLKPGKGDIEISDDQPGDLGDPENPPADSGNRFARYHKSIVSGVRGALKVVAGFIGKRATQAGFSGDFVKEIKTEMVPAGDSADAKEFADAVEDFSTNLELCLTKWGVSDQFAPEVALGLAGFRLGQPVVSVLQKLDAEIERRKLMEKTPDKPRE